MGKFLSGPVQNEVLTIKPEHPSYVDHFERKFQAKISPYDQSFEEQEEELIKFKEEHHDELGKFSSILMFVECEGLDRKG